MTWFENHGSAHVTYGAFTNHLPFASAQREVLLGRRSSGAVDWRRWLVFAVVAVAFFAAALSNDVYNLTSPPSFDLHVLLRKIYSVIAFAVVGALYVWASGATITRSTAIVAAYSGAIEIAQHFTYGREPLFWNGIDVICGALGGALGALMPWVRAK